MNHREQVIAAMGGRLTENDDAIIDRVTGVVTEAVASERERCSVIAAQHVVMGHNGQRCGTPGTLSCGVAIAAAIRDDAVDEDEEFRLILTRLKAIPNSTDAPAQCSRPRDPKA